MAHSIAELSGRAHEVAAGILTRLEGLKEADWTQPSGCVGWTVADLTAHLVQACRLFDGIISRAVAGHDRPLPGETGDVASWQAWREREIGRLAALPRAELLAELREAYGGLREAFGRAATVDPATIGRHPRRGPHPLSWYASRWLVEMTLHDWDLRVGTDPEAELNPAGLPLLLPELRLQTERNYGPPEGVRLSGVVRIELGEPAPAAWLAKLGEGRLEVLDDGAARPDATLRADPAAYALVVTARRPAASFVERGCWRVEGDVALVEHLAAAFVGY